MTATYTLKAERRVARSIGDMFCAAASVGLMMFFWGLRDDVEIWRMVVCSILFLLLPTWYIIMGEVES